MKIRNGFVSNSSSSSFILYGFFLDEEDYDKISNIEDMQNYWDYINDMDEDGYLIGNTIMRIDDGDFRYLNPSYFSTDTLEEKRKELINKFNEIGIDFSEEEFHLILGNHYS